LHHQGSRQGQRAGAEPGVRLCGAVGRLHRPPEHPGLWHHRAAVPAGRRSRGMSARRVLLVEDERALLMLVGDALEDLGFEVTAVASGRQAVGLLEAGSGFDMVVSDISMPEGVSGLEIAERAMEAVPRARVIL